MPTSPRATVVGLGLAAVISAAVILIPVAIITGMSRSVAQREQIRTQSRDAVHTLIEEGMASDRGTAAETIAIDGTPVRLLPVVGPLSAFETSDVPLHRQPGKLLIFLGTVNEAQQTVSAADLDRPNDAEGEPTLAEFLGTPGPLGLPAVFRDGTVWLLHGTTPVREVQPFMRRDTMATADRDNLKPFVLRE